MDGERARDGAPEGANINEKSAPLGAGTVVTIDGPAGSGKSTTASLLAGRLGFTYLDTGAMYRAVTLAALERGVDSADGRSLAVLAQSAKIELRGVGGRLSVYLDGRNVDREIRGREVSRLVSPVSVHEEVRRAMVRLQRRAGDRGGIVAEGRDTGSVVFPHAAVRVFLVADAEARACRREKQLRSLGIEQGIDEIRENIRARDAMDSGRALSPLVRPAGAPRHPAGRRRQSSRRPSPPTATCALRRRALVDHRVDDSSRRSRFRSALSSPLSHSPDVS